MDFSRILIGKEYSRQTLSDLWGYKSIDAIRRGVITPQGTNFIILFVTKEKSQYMTKYEDHIDQDILFWEGENAHGSDQRIILKRDFIHVFYREIERSNFIYQGRAELMNYQLFQDRPSKFIFRLIDQLVTEKNIVEEVRHSYGLSETEKQAIIKSRRGQGIYRTNSIKLWKTCSVTGFTKPNVLIASHIKPWKVSSNIERVDSFNSLLLVPSLDKMFDKGYISFENNGKILISEKISGVDLNRIGVTIDLRLKQVPSDTQNYLSYHREYRFDIIDH